jgi:hypothetical protein
MLTFDFVSRRSQKPMPVMDHKKFMVGGGGVGICVSILVSLCGAPSNKDKLGKAS